MNFSLSETTAEASGMAEDIDSSLPGAAEITDWNENSPKGGSPGFSLHFW